MYLLFTNQKSSKRSTYFIPWIWHWAWMLPSVFVIFCVFDVEWLGETFDENGHAFIATLVLASFFIIESAVYIYFTKNMWSKFVDFYYNLRIFVVFSVLIYPTCLYIIFATLAYQFKLM
eukprot:Awhi_evm1s5991